MFRFNAAVPQQGNLWNGQYQNPNIGQGANASQQRDNQARAEDAQMHRWQLAGFPRRPAVPNELDKKTCVICDEEHPTKELCTLSCNHGHCRGCFIENFRVALLSNPFVPAKCCSVIPTELLRQFGGLTPNDIEQYKAKMEELTNPRSKLYCWECAAYIPLNRRTKRIGDCNVCGRRTCKTCRAKSHFGACDKTKIQADEEAENNVYLLAESNGWKRCPNCLNLIQKSGGCNHMTCNCGENFCYLCGEVYGIHGGPSHRCERQEQENQRRIEQQQRRREHQRERQIQNQLQLWQQQQIYPQAP
ncbi:hypothetical protein F4680DRAFT_455073 [Xylaria scruposa]|nr:hypothetical protein F4680DRAFT_455073 [Xylaria scruposa]